MRRVHNANASAAAAAGAEGKSGLPFRSPDVMETVHEVAIYIHRFHNLDLFQQGYGRVKSFFSLFGLSLGFSFP